MKAIKYAVFYVFDLNFISMYHFNKKLNTHHSLQKFTSQFCHKRAKWADLFLVANNHLIICWMFYHHQIFYATHELQSIFHCQN